MIKFLPLLILLLCGHVGFCQNDDNSSSGISKLSPKTFSAIGNQAASVDKQVTDKAYVYLNRMSAKEAQLQKLVAARDSSAASRIFSASRAKYTQLLAALKLPGGSASQPALKEYLPSVDSMHSALNFLGSGPNQLNLSSSALAAVTKAGGQLQHLEGSWQQARDIEAFIQQREKQLTAQLAGYNVGSQLLEINKTAFYYQQQLADYKSLLQDRNRLREKVLSTVRSSAAFQTFMQKNSYVGRLFSLPDNYGTAASLPGLQTKDQIQQRIGLATSAAPTTGGGADPGQYLQQKVDDGQQQISQLKSKLRELGQSSGGGEMVMPQFTPNDQKTRTFLKRIQYSVSLQTQQSYGIMPATASLGLTLGYKLSSKATVGVGGSYNIGLGQGLTHLSYSGQGAGIRSFIDVKAKGSLWLTGGFEYNYVQGFSSWRDLGNWDQWQKSALFGLSKKFKLSGNKSSNIQLLFDALYKQHEPASAPLVFRVGYSFN